jgi:hypothetical protein
VPDWTAISSAATAAGTLVLAVATYSSVRSANRSARAAERSLLAGQRPVLIPSREDDPAELVRFGEGRVLTVHGHGCAAEVHDDRIYMALGLRNAGAGLAVIHGWQAKVIERLEVPKRPDHEQFRRQLRDLYIPDGETGFWQGAIRDAEDEDHAALKHAIEAGRRVIVDILYSDYEGGQRSIVRFGINRSSEDADFPDARADVLRYWNVDGDDPR